MFNLNLSLIALRMPFDPADLEPSNEHGTSEKHCSKLSLTNLLWHTFAYHRRSTATLRLRHSSANIYTGRKAKVRVWSLAVLQFSPPEKTIRVSMHFLHPSPKIALMPALEEKLMWLV